MHLGEYIHRCREEQDLTQDGLAEELYLFDDEHFSGIDASTISKWERRLSAPPTNRLSAILRFFQERTGKALPCWSLENEEQIEGLLLDSKISQIVGSSRKLISRSSLDVDYSKEFRLLNLRESPRADEMLEIAAMLAENGTTDFTRVPADKLKEWIEIPENLFFALGYKGAILGHFFVIRLKPDTFDAVMRLEKRKADLAEEDFATCSEPSSIYILTFKALSSSVGTHLMARFWAHLIAHRERTKEVGFLSILDEARKIAMKVGLKEERNLGPDRQIRAYRATIEDLLSSEPMLHSLFGKEDGAG